MTGLSCTRHLATSVRSIIRKAERESSDVFIAREDPFQRKFYRKILCCFYVHFDVDHTLTIYLIG